MFQTQPYEDQETMMLQMAKQLGLRIATSPDPSLGAQKMSLGGSPTRSPKLSRDMEASPSPSGSRPTTPRNRTLRGATETGGQQPPNNSSSTTTTTTSRLASQNRRPRSSVTDSGTYMRCTSEPLPEDIARRFFSGSRPQSPMAPGKRGRLEECILNGEMCAGGNEQLLQDPGSPSSRRRLVPGDARRLQENLMATEAFSAAASKATASTPASQPMHTDEEPIRPWSHPVRSSIDGPYAGNHNLSSLSHTSNGRSNKPNPVSLFNRFLVNRNTWDGSQDGLADFSPDRGTRGSAERQKQGQEDGMSTAAAGEEAGRGSQELPGTPEARMSTGDASVMVLQSQVRSLQEELHGAQLQLAASRAQAEVGAARIAALEKQLESTKQQAGSWRKLYLETLPGR